MKFTTTLIAATATALASSAVASRSSSHHGHRALHHRHNHQNEERKLSSSSSSSSVAAISSSYNMTRTAAAKAAEERTFAVLRFVSEGGKFSVEGSMDPIVAPGAESSHLHGIMGGNAFGLTVDGDQLLGSNCTNANIVNDKSNYWVAPIYFQDPNDGTFTQVPLYYMNVYYFFEPTNDAIVPFPPGLKMISGDASLRSVPEGATGSLQLDPSKGTIQPIQWTCPTVAGTGTYPAGSDGSTAGIQDPTNFEAGMGFPTVNCDLTASPLRQDIHFPSCYDPSASLDDFVNNSVFPSVGTDWKQDCPEGWTHHPHMFFEVYYDTQSFADRWTPDGVTQPFVLANGDRTGFSSHGDFISGWDETTLQTIIDTCNAGHEGMQACPDIPGGVNLDDSCLMESAFPAPEGTEGLTALPGDNPLSGWGV